MKDAKVNSHNGFNAELRSNLVEQIISDRTTEQRIGNEKTTIVRCIATEHPVLLGRVQVEIDGAPVWLATLQGTAIRKNDRVLIQSVSNSDEPIVVGVVDGYRRRPAVPRNAGPSLKLENDEAIKVLASNGERLLEIHNSDDGPVVRILNADTHIQLPGQLQVTANAISLNAAQGSVRITATDDVEVQGEEIRLN